MNRAQTRLPSSKSPASHSSSNEDHDLSASDSKPIGSDTSDNSLNSNQSMLSNVNSASSGRTGYRENNAIRRQGQPRITRSRKKSANMSPEFSNRRSIKGSSTQPSPKMSDGSTQFKRSARGRTRNVKNSRVPENSARQTIRQVPKPTVKRGRTRPSRRTSRIRRRSKTTKNGRS